MKGHRTLQVLSSLTVAFAVMACTVSTTPTSATPSSRSARVAAQAAVLPAPIPGQYMPFGVDRGAHAGFPAAVKLPSGQVRIAWRESSGHLATDGKTMTAVGDPAGNTWSTPTEIVLDNSAPGRDMRPGALSLVDGKVRLTYFYSVGGVPAGAFVVTSEDGGATWGTSVRVDGGRPYAAVSAPMVKIGTKLVVPWYGRNTGEALDTVWIAQSMDGGASWTQNRIANGLASNRTYTEPWALVKGNTLLLLYRDGAWDAIGSRTTLNGDQPVPTWQAPRSGVVTGATGNSASVWTSSGTIYMVVRATGSRAAVLVASSDSGATWWTVDTLMRPPANLGADSVGMTYADPIELGAGLVWCPIGMEQSLNASRIYVGWL